MNKKLGISIPLKAKSVSSDWKKVCENLWLTLQSLEQQSHEQFSWVVVGHDEPEFFKDNAFTFGHFISAQEISPPQREKYSGDELRWEFEKDRCYKIDKGIHALLDTGHSHFYVLDADDLLHRDFVQEWYDNSDKDAMLIQHGYMYFAQSHTLVPNSELSAWCGSTCVVSKNFLDAEFIEKQSNATSFFKQTSHCDFKRVLEQSGKSLHIPKKKLLVYMQDNGENISTLDKTYGPLKAFIVECKKRLKLFILGLGSQQSVLREFGVSSCVE